MDRPTTAPCSLSSKRAEIEPEIVELTVAGKPLPARLFRAEAGAPAVVIAAALGTPAGVYRRFAIALAERGVNVLAADLRGIGDSPFRASRRCGWGYLDLADDELPTMLAAAADAFPGSPRFLFGHSLGGQLSLLHASRGGERNLAGLIFCASGTPYWRSFGRWTLGIRLFAMWVRLWCALFGQFHGELLGFGGHQPARLMREWAGFCRNGVLRDSHGENLSAGFAGVRLPALAIGMAEDMFAPQSSIDGLLALSGAQAEKQFVEQLPDGRPPRHFDWLKQPEDIASRVAAFCQRVVSA